MPESFAFPVSLETDRLILRPVRLDDGLLLNEAVCESFNELHAWMPWANSRPTISESVGVCRKLRKDWLLRQELMILFLHKQLGEIIGCGGFHHFDWTVPACDTGYWCRTKYTGQGFITEAVRALADFALRTWNFKRIGLRCDERNRQSCRVAERAGFELEGTLRCDTRTHLGLMRNTRVYSIVRSAQD